MSPAANCPRLDALRQVVYGGLPPAEEEALEAHLLLSGACFAAARQLEAADALLQDGMATAALPEECSPTQPHLRDLVRRLKGLRALAPPAVATPAELPAPAEPAPVRPHGPAREVYDRLAPPQAPDELGRLVPYRVLEVLGSGGMGVVFRAEDPHLPRLVALKAMLPALAASPSARQRFFREARAAAALKHDHVVTIHQIGEDRGAPFLAMEFLEGESLEDRLRWGRKLLLKEVLRVGREMAEGLAAAHERGLIHRDVKPANIWLEGQRGRVKILDFGLARAANDDLQLTQQGVVVGTPAYMAPEQGAGQPVDHRCDLFSLGCVLYRACTGRLAFVATNIIATLRAVATEQPPAPHEIDAGVPPALSDLIMELLAKKPEDRPASAAAVGQALEAIEKTALAVTTTEPRPSGIAAAQPSQPGDAATVAESAARLQGPAPGRGRASRRRWAVAAALLLVLGVLGYYALFVSSDINHLAVLLLVLVLGLLGYFVGGPILRFVTNQGRAGRQPRSAAGAAADKHCRHDGRLDPAQIPVAERFDWQPKELVAVIGEHRQRHWSEIHSLAISPDGKQGATGSNNGQIRR